MGRKTINFIKLIIIVAILGILGVAPASTLAGPAEQQPASKASTIQRIKERGKLIAGVKYDFKPFGFLDDSGGVIGFDVDLIRAIADQWGIEVEFVQVTSANRIPKLLAGEVDIVAASMTHTKDRDELIDFSQTYFLDGQSLLVQQNTGIAGIKDLEDKVVAAVQGSTSIDQIQTYAAEKGVSIEILPFKQYPSALEALKSGQVDALTSDSVALLQSAQDNPGLIVVGGLFTREPYGFGLPAGDSFFNNLVDFTLQTLKEEGTYNKLYRKWFGPQALPYEIEVLPGKWPYTFADSPAALNSPEQSKVERILAEGSFVAGVKYDFEPFGYLDENNQVVGFDVDIVKEFARRWLGDENAVELVRVTSSSRIQKLTGGEVDLVAALMTHKKERDETIDFSQTYFLDGQSLLVRRDSGINSLNDLDGKTVTAIQGSTSIDTIQLEAARRDLNIEILPFKQYPPAVAAVAAGQSDALTAGSVALLQSGKDNPDLLVVGGRFTREPYGLGVPNYDARFKDLVNFTLQAMKEDGSYNAIYCRWFGANRPYGLEIWPGEPQDAQLQAMINTNSPLEADSHCPGAAGASAPPESETPLPAPAAGEDVLPAQYTVVKGDTLSLLAGRFYGDILLWTSIYHANRDVIGDDPDFIEVDMVLTIPVP